MTLQAIQLAPNNNLSSGVPTGGYRSGPGEWGSGISAAIQAAGLSKSQCEGFNIFRRISKTWNQPAASANPGSPQFVIPINVKTNDFMLVQVTYNTGTTITPPGGWTLIRTDTATGGTGPVIQSLYYRYAAGTAGQFSTDCNTAFTWTLSNINNAAAANLLVLGGVALASPIDVQGVTSSSAAGTTATAGALTTTGPYRWVLQLLGTSSVATCSITSAVPANYFWRCSNNGWATGGSIFAQNSEYDTFQAAAGTTGTPAFTLGASSGWIIQTLALVPTAPGTANAVAPVLTPSASGGTLASATYYYRISAISGANYATSTPLGETLACAEQSVVVTGPTGSVAISWAQIPNAIGYRVYGRTSGAEQLLQTVMGGTTLTWTDTGAITPSGLLPTTDLSADINQMDWGNAGYPTNPAGGPGSYPGQWYQVAGVASALTCGYEIFQFTDALQPTAPVFIRLDYSNQTVSYYNPVIWARVSTTTDGNGNPRALIAFPNSIIGVGPNASYNVFYQANASWYTGVNYPFWVDSDGGASLMLFGWQNIANLGAASGGGLVIERTRDWDGSLQNEGVMYCMAPAGQASYSQTMMIANASVFSPTTFTAGNPIANLLAGFSPTPSGLATVGQTVYVYPYMPACTPRLNAPSKHLLMFYPGDIAPMSQFTVTEYGVSHTFFRSYCWSYSSGTSNLAFRLT